MKHLYRIKINENAPRLLIDPASPYASEFTELDGSLKSQLSPRKEFPAKPSLICDWQQIYAVSPGGFALSEKAWEECEDIYYVLSMGNELLAAGDGKHYFRIINPVGFAPPSDNPNRPFDLDNFNSPIFRLRNYAPTDLFCLSGSRVPGDEFKYSYDKFGFIGLIFEEIWSGE
jgi:hypothetical protein